MPRCELHIFWKGEDVFNSVYLKHSKQRGLKRKNTQNDLVMSYMTEAGFGTKINLQRDALVLVFQ